MVKFYRKSVTLSDLWVSTNDRLSDFHLSAWQRGESPVPTLVIRLLLTGLILAIIGWSLVSASNVYYWLIYLTNWGLLLITAMMLSGTVTSIMAFGKTDMESDQLPWYTITYWFLFNVSVPIALLITALYWSLLYDPEPEIYDPRLFWLDVMTHGVNSCIVIVEVMTSRTPVRALHVYQPLGVALWFAAFSGIYYAAGGTDEDGNPFIYELLDWRQGRRAGSIVAGSIAGLLVIYAVVWSVAICREKVSISLVRTIKHDLPLAPPDQHTV